MLNSKPSADAHFARAETVRIAKEATVAVLKSALKNGANVKRIVITSSIGAVWTNQAEPRTFSEDDWNEHTLPKYESGQRDPVTAYFASKLLAERGWQRAYSNTLTRKLTHCHDAAVWEFLEAHKKDIPWDVAVLNVPFVCSQFC